MCPPCALRAHTQACGNNPVKVALNSKLLRDKHMETLVQIATSGELKALQQLDLSNNQLTDDGLSTLMSALDSLPALKVISLKNNRFTTDGLTAAHAKLEERHVGEDES